MQTVTKIEEVRELVRQARSQGKRVGFVPTMGALHAGHASLVARAAAECDFVVVSIFVNPTQFAPTEDLSAYPRTPEQDAELCRRHGAAVLFLPSVEVMYDKGAKTTVSVRDLGDNLCGKSRPTHFAGVCLVVAKFFNIVLPDRAYFGAKDFQQAAIIQKMVADLNFPVEIVLCPIVREADGLAMSSRNRYLTPQERQQAIALSESLQMAKGLIEARRPASAEVIAAIRSHLASRAPLGKEDYVQIVDPRELVDVEKTDGPVLVALAVRFGRARLIDNILVDAPLPKA